MKAFLINLDRSIDRLKLMEERFAAAGLSFSRVPAEDGGAWSASTLEAFAEVRPLHTRWTSGVAACLVSHLKTWRLVAGGTDSHAAIFEDDVHIAADAKQLLTRADWIPADADVLRLEANGAMRLAKGRALADTRGRFVHRALSGTWGSAAYIISRKAARRALLCPAALHHSPDLFLFKPPQSPFAETLRVYQVRPAVCIQDMLLTEGRSGLGSLINGPWPVAIRNYRKRHLLSYILPGRKRPVRYRP